MRRSKTGEDQKWYLCRVCRAEISEDDASCIVCGALVPEFSEEPEDEEE